MILEYQPGILAQLVPPASPSSGLAHRYTIRRNVPEGAFAPMTVRLPRPLEPRGRLGMERPSRSDGFRAFLPWLATSPRYWSLFGTPFSSRRPAPPSFSWVFYSLQGEQNLTLFFFPAGERRLLSRPLRGISMGRGRTTVKWSTYIFRALEYFLRSGSNVPVWGEGVNRGSRGPQPRLLALCTTDLQLCASGRRWRLMKLLWTSFSQGEYRTSISDLQRTGGSRPGRCRAG